MTDVIHSTTERAFRGLTGGGEPPTRPGVSEGALRAEPGNFMRHVSALSFNKAADGLVDAKLVLAWLMTALGAPAAFIGLLVPIREAGALLPQLFVAARLRAIALRKWVWVWALVLQGLSVLAMAAIALTMEGVAAGIALCVALGVLAVARSAASVTYKDLLGKTIAQGRRGTVTGLATALAPVVVIGFALILMLDGGARLSLVIGALALAGVFWLLAGGIVAGVQEEDGATEGRPKGLAEVFANLRYLREDRLLRHFIISRGLLTSTALAPPYLVLLGAGAAGEAMAGLGALVLASALAGLVSGYVWGRLADRSSRKVLIATGTGGAAAMGLALGADALGLAGSVWALPVVLFLLMLVHQGVRVGRTTYLVDMAPPDLRAVYVAVANTVIGVVLLAGGIFGAIAAIFGPGATLFVFALMALGGAAMAWRLEEGR